MIGDLVPGHVEMLCLEVAPHQELEQIYGFSKFLLNLWNMLWF